MHPIGVGHPHPVHRHRAPDDVMDAGDDLYYYAAPINK